MLAHVKRQEMLTLAYQAAKAVRERPAPRQTPSKASTWRQTAGAP